MFICCEKIVGDAAVGHQKSFLLPNEDDLSHELKPDGILPPKKAKPRKAKTTSPRPMPKEDNYLNTYEKSWPPLPSTTLVSDQVRFLLYEKNHPSFFSIKKIFFSSGLSSFSHLFLLTIKYLFFSACRIKAKSFPIGPQDLILRVLGDLRVLAALELCLTFSNFWLISR